MKHTENQAVPELKKGLTLQEEFDVAQELFYQQKPKEAEELISLILSERFSISLDELKPILISYLKNNVDAIAEQLPYIAPNNDWSKCITDQNDIKKWLIDCATNSKDWSIYGITETDIPKVWSIMFTNFLAETDGHIVGYVYVSEFGKIKHVFVQRD